MNKNIENVFILLEERPQMLLGENLDYFSYCNFLAGIEIGLGFRETTKVLSFNEWLENKEEKGFALTWSSYILQKNNNKEEDAIAMLLHYFKQYLEELDRSLDLSK